MNLLPVSDSRVTALESPLHMPFSISKGAVETVQNVLIEFQDDSGATGIGEAAPFPVLTGDTQEIALKAARELASAVAGKTPASALELLHKNLWQEFNYSPTARTGIEMALWDLHARQLKCPLHMLWGRADVSHAETDITLPCLQASEVATFWRHFSDHRFPYVKVKVGGGSLSDDVERVEELLRCAGRGLRLSLDGNQGFQVESAKRLVFELLSRKIDILFFEQPLPEDDYAGMSRLTETLSIPVCADESVKTLSDALRVINEKCAQMINLKFMKSGVRESLLIAEVARRCSIQLMIGGMVESEIAMTASLHAVCGTGSIRWCDLDTPFFLQNRFTAQSPYHSKSAKLALPAGIGLGLNLQNTERPS
ncbi:MAG: dipeptide epimerase [Proteobacteria bacterium]|nr:dipeptide epimerase [Pseudomonadota bacterium]